MATSQEQMEQSKNVALGMQQFERLHTAHVHSSGDIVCEQCDTDWPCARMVNMMVLQGIAQFQRMIPGGNIMGALARFNEVRK